MASKSLFVQISSPEALATSIRILPMFSVVLVHSRSQIPTHKKAAKTRVDQNDFLTPKIEHVSIKITFCPNLIPRSFRHIHSNPTDVLYQNLPECRKKSTHLRYRYFVRSGKMLEKCAWPNLDAMSVPEALVYSILHHFARRWHRC